MQDTDQFARLLHIQSLDTYFAELTPEECARIESVPMDMWPACIRVVERYVPDAPERRRSTLKRARA